MNVAYNLDCMEAMRQLPDRAFDLAVVDPPYFDGPNRRGYYGSKRSVGPRVVYNRVEKWEPPDQAYFEQLFRISKQQIVWGCNYYDYHFGPGRIIWDKCNGTSSFSDCEIAYCSLHDSVRMFRYICTSNAAGKTAPDADGMSRRRRGGRRCRWRNWRTGAWES